MKKIDLVKAIKDYANFGNDTEVNHRQVAVVIEGLAEQIKKTLSSGGEITLAGIGKFSTGERAARKGRNPQTGEEIIIPAAKVAKFKPLKALKDAINQ